MPLRVLHQALATVLGWRRLFQPGRREPAGQKLCSKTTFMAEIRREAPVKRPPLAAKILRTKNINDVDPHWAPPAFIGTSWSLIETRQGPFLSGVLVNPRGGVLPGRVFVIASEWDCG